jgi:aminoglycoside 2'-N-acetyltransferase I
MTEPDSIVFAGGRVPRLFTCSEAELGAELKSRVIALLATAWPDERSLAEQLRAPLHNPNQHPRYVMLIDGDDVLSYLVIPSTVIHLGDCEYRAAGLSAVITDPRQRGRGYGQQLVTAARDMIASSDADIGVFTCDPPLVDFYVRCGWTLMECTSVFGGTRARPFAADALGKRTLMEFCSARAKQHRQGFEDAALYLELDEGELW